MSSPRTLTDKMMELAHVLGRDVDPLLVLIEIGNGIDRFGQEIADKLIASKCLDPVIDSALLTELRVPSRQARITALSASAKFLYPTNANLMITSPDEASMSQEMKQLMADPEMSKALEELNEANARRVQREVKAVQKYREERE